MDMSRIKQKEQYILSRNRRGILDKLTEGSDEYYLFHLVYWMHKGKLSEKVTDQILTHYEQQAYNRNYRKTEPYVYSLFYQYDFFKKESIKIEILQLLQEKVFKVNLKHKKPAYLVGSSLKTSKKKTPSVLDYNLISTRNYLIDAYEYRREFEKVKSLTVLSMDLTRFKKDMIEKAYQHLQYNGNISLHQDVVEFLKKY